MIFKAHIKLHQNNFFKTTCKNCDKMIIKTHNDKITTNLHQDD